MTYIGEHCSIFRCRPCNECYKEEGDKMLSEEAITTAAIQRYMMVLFLEARGWKEVLPWKFQLERLGGTILPLREAFDKEVTALTGLAFPTIFAEIKK